MIGNPSTNSPGPDATQVAHDEHSAKSERTLLVSWLLSAPGPLVTGVAVAMSSSATQIADAIRRTVELAALFIGWWAFRRRKSVAVEAERQRLERRVEVSVAVALAVSGTVMLGIGGYRFFNYEPGGNVVVGLIVAVLGTGVNAFFWARYSGLLRHAFDPVIGGQLRLYRAKTLVDLAVTAALLTVMFAPTHPATHYVDTVGSVFVAGYLLYQALSFRRRMSLP
ncbi:MAG: cation transporter [Trueperaceae bacterium]